MERRRGVIFFRGVRSPYSERGARAPGSGVGRVLRSIKAPGGARSASKTARASEGRFVRFGFFSFLCFNFFLFFSLVLCVVCVSVTSLPDASPAPPARSPRLLCLIMPRCLMAKKWKSYPWPVHQQPSATEEDEEEIDVVGDGAGASTGPCWGPSSPTAAATAPSPPPQSPLASDTSRASASASASVLYHGESNLQTTHVLTTWAGSPCVWPTWLHRHNLLSLLRLYTQQNHKLKPHFTYLWLNYLS